MNIFILDTDPVIAASYHCDQHLHKMILESAQMLSTAARLRSYQGLDSILYKSAFAIPVKKFLTDSTRFWRMSSTIASEAF